MNKEIVANNFYQELKKLLRQHGMLFVEIGRILTIIKDEEYYKIYAETFAEFLADPNLPIKPSTAYAYMDIYKIFVMKFGYSPESLADSPWYKLQLLLPVVKQSKKEEVDEWLEKAKSLSLSDFRLEVGEIKENKGFSKKMIKPSIYRCKDCGKWIVDCRKEDLCQCRKNIG